MSIIKDWITFSEKSAFSEKSLKLIDKDNLNLDYYASKNPAPNTILVSLSSGLINSGWLANSIRNFTNTIDVITYYSENLQDYPLAIGEVAEINFSSVTSQPLRVATQDGTMYFLSVLPSNTGGTSEGSSNPIWLNPNNTTYSGAFFYAQIGRDANVTISNYESWFSSFRIAWSISHIHMFILNRTVYKSIIGIINYYGTSSGYPGLIISATNWRDTTTEWTSLGTLSFPVSTSGRILVWRLM